MHKTSLIIFCLFVAIRCMGAYEPNPQVQWQNVIDAPNIVKVYNGEGMVNAEIKMWVDDIVPGTATGQTVDISSAGFSTVLCAHATNTSGSLVWCLVTGMNNNQLTLNLYEPSDNLITLLGASVLSGSPVVAADNLGTITLHVTVVGY